jgi:8-oxo-dGTP pyrophosphatase MutT (NUDIX family)
MSAVLWLKLIGGGSRMSWETKWEGKIWAIEQAEQPNGAIFERASRPPGSRLLIVRDGSILLSRESRKELAGRVDHRLPGGKVFDTNKEYQDFLLTNADILEASRLSASREALEEVGVVVDPSELRHYATDILGATCSWDLIYWVCETFSFHEDGAQYNETESSEIEGFVWMDIVEACRMVLDKKQFSESRSALTLLSYASEKGIISL